MTREFCWTPKHKKVPFWTTSACSVCVISWVSKILDTPNGKSKNSSRNMNIDMYRQFFNEVKLMFYFIYVINTEDIL